MKPMIAIVLAATALSACETANEPRQRSAEMQALYEKTLAGKTPGKSDSCLPTYRSNDMTVIDERTILFRDGRTTWVNTMIGECNQLGRAGYAIVSRSTGTQLCRGDIATVTDTTSGASVGSCAYGDFVPYRPAG